MFSESECFVLGALESANSDGTRPFHEHFEDIGKMLGFLRISRSSVPLGESVADVPSDTKWGVYEGTWRFLTQEEKDQHVSELTHNWDEAMDYLENELEADEETRTLLRLCLTSVCKAVSAFGYARSTPSAIYSLNMAGTFEIHARVDPLPSGFLRLLLERLALCSVMPMGWLMAVPAVVQALSEDALEDAAPSPEFEQSLIGTDLPDIRRERLAELAGIDASSPAFALGRRIWGLRTLCHQWANIDVTESEEDHGEVESIAPEAEEPPDDLDAGAESQADSFGDADDEDSPNLPTLLATIVELKRLFEPHVNSVGNHARQAKAKALNDQIKGITQDAEAIKRAALDADMPSVETILSSVLTRLSNYGDGLTLRALAVGTVGQADTLMDDIVRQVDHAFCLAYGDLLLRERYDPAPLPRGPARAEMLRQPENIRALLMTAISRLRRDSEQGSNCAVEMTLLCVVLERLVREAASLYMDNCRSVKVADLLHDLLKERHRHSSPEREEIEAIGRIGTALHHTFRNPTVHQIESISGDWEEAMFVAFGLLSVLNIIDKAKRRRDG
jgi:hypothetical protein